MITSVVLRANKVNTCIIISRITWEEAPLSVMGAQVSTLVREGQLPLQRTACHRGILTMYTCRTPLVFSSLIILIKSVYLQLRHDPECVNLGQEHDLYNVLSVLGIISRCWNACRSMMCIISIIINSIHFQFSLSCTRSISKQTWCTELCSQWR